VISILKLLVNSIWALFKTTTAIKLKIASKFGHCRKLLFVSILKSLVFLGPVENYEWYQSCSSGRSLLRVRGINLKMRVFHPTPPFATLLGFHVLLFSHIRLETLLATVMVLAPFSPPIVQFRPYGTSLTFQCLWRGLLCHGSSLPDARHCLPQPCRGSNDGGIN
jgi:hypothetical protein